MKPNLFLEFKRRFEKVKEIEAHEIKKASVEEKFRQLSSLIFMAAALGISLNKGRKKQMIDTNFARLKIKT